MFKQIKSALIWIYLIKFRRRLILISLLLSFAFLANYIHTDLVEFLTATDQRHLLIFALLFKWAIVFFSIFGIIYTILGIFKSQKAQIPKKPKRFGVRLTKAQKTSSTDAKAQEPLQEASLSAREIDFMAKNKLKNQTDFLINEFDHKKGNLDKHDQKNGTNFEAKSASRFSLTRLRQTFALEANSEVANSAKKLKENNQDLFEREKRLLEKPRLLSKEDFILKKQPKK